MKHHLIAAGFLTTLGPSALAGGPRGEVQLDLSISPAGARASSDSDVASAGNRIFVAWTEAAVAPATTSEIYFSRSDDGGRSWTSPTPLSATASVDDAKPSVAADGSRVVIGWLHGPLVGVQDVQGIVSQDGGVTFGPVLDLGGSLMNDSGDADSLRAKILGTNVYLSFEDDAASPGASEDIYVVASTNGGTSFAGPVRINDSTAGTVDCDDPELDTVGSTAYVVWVDKRTGNDRVYFDRTTDGGTSWTTDKRLDRAGAVADAGNPSMAAEGSNVHIAWTDDRNNAGVADAVFYVASADSGVSFTLDKKLGSAGSSVDANVPRLAVAGSYVHAVWADDRNGLDDLFFTSSSNGGTTFAAEFALDPDQGALPDLSPHLRSHGDSVYVLYKEGTHAPTLDQIWLSHSNNRGAPGSFQRLQLSATLAATADADDHQFTVSDARDVVAVWTDDRAGGLNNDVYVNGQRFPELDAVPNGKFTSFQLSGATPAEEGRLFLALFSLTGTNSFLLPNGMNLCLTVDSFTILLIQPWAIPLISDTVLGGAASTLDLPLKATGFAVGLIIDPVGPLYLAATDPVQFN